MKSVADWCVSPEFLSDNMMGPNSMAIVQELLQGQKLTPGMRVLDVSTSNLQKLANYGVGRKLFL